MTKNGKFFFVFGIVLTIKKISIRILKQSLWITPMSKKVQVSFSDSQMAVLEYLKGEFGETDAEVVRNIVLAWLSEKSFITTIAKQKLSTQVQEKQNEKI